MRLKLSAFGMILGATSFVFIITLSAPAAQAQCAAVGLNKTPLGPVVTQAAGMAVAKSGILGRSPLRLQ
jgi:hypothetical protein